MTHHVSSAPAVNYKPIESLRRGLAILQSLNQEPAGRASISKISRATGLHRTTVRRMLETLQAEGYVRRNPSSEHYSLNRKVRLLSDGFTDGDWVCEAAGKALERLQHKAIWPSDFCVLEGRHMVVRESTHRSSPLSLHRAVIDQRMPVLFTAVGRAYLSACPDTEREEILRLLRQGHDEQARLARNARLVDALLQKTRSQGFGANDGDWLHQDKVRALALPVRAGARVLGCINIIFFKRAMRIEEAAPRLLPLLQEAVHDIEHALAQC
ncbi:DNA-binding transcriptional regulator [Vandammella animalimorsus]|uniref:DNA-binding transcriptional regulator n=1 Tax=Vandammella animalimorsus TaxID=2029117 RepID=A0A3M6RSS0_9BURK|nr:DNA-binding transcriptional regulator [Vandammella animalimorsus]RMX18509.1 DNA-binding transcriptional regulator [Vandammella animalimorsus]